MNSEPKSSTPVVSTSYSPRKIKTGSKLWPFWVAAFTMLAAFGTGSVGAAPHAKNTPKTKTNHARPVAQVTRLFATGAVDPATSTVKALTTDNRFTWVRLIADTVLIQGGKPISPDTIVEGDKLLCQGIWVDDAWGPIYQAKRVEIIGNVGDEGLRSRVAAACQAVQGSSTPASDDATPSTEIGDSDLTKMEATEKDDQTRQDAVVRAFAEVARLSNAADKNAALRHDPQAIKAMRNAVAKYDGVLDWADSLTIPSPEIGGLDDSIRREMADAFRASENYDRLADQQMKLWANLRLEYFGRNNQHSLALEVQAIQRSNKLDDAAHNVLEKERVALQQKSDALGL